MLQTWAVIGVLLVVGLTVAYVIDRHRRPKRPSDEQLREWLAYLTKQVAGSSKAFRKATTARLSETEYEDIRRLFHPKLSAEWEERFGKLQNEFAIRAIEAEQVIRLQAEGRPLSSHDQEIRFREGLQQRTQPFAEGETKNEDENIAGS